MKNKSGECFDYSNFSSYLPGVIIEKKTGVKLFDYANHKLFKPPGIKNIYWPESPDSVNIGWGELQLRPCDMVKIGQLYLNKGEWPGRQLVSKKWVMQSTFSHVKADTIFKYYGFQWWNSGKGYYLAVGYRG